MKRACLLRDRCRRQAAYLRDTATEACHRLPVERQGTGHWPECFGIRVEELDLAQHARERLRRTEPLRILDRREPFAKLAPGPLDVKDHPKDIVQRRAKPIAGQVRPAGRPGCRSSVINPRATRQARAVECRSGGRTPRDAGGTPADPGESLQARRGPRSTAPGVARPVLGAFDRRRLPFRRHRTRAGRSCRDPSSDRARARAVPA